MSESTYTITGGPFKAHEYVIVRREMTAGDEAWIQNQSATLTGPQKNPQMQLTIGNVRLATLKRMITAWNLTREDENSGLQVPIPLTMQAIEDMPRRYSAYIARVIDKLNPEEDESDEDFLAGANGSSTEHSKPTSLDLLKP